MITEHIADPTGQEVMTEHTADPTGQEVTTEHTADPTGHEVTTEHTADPTGGRKGGEVQTLQEAERVVKCRPYRRQREW